MTANPVPRRGRPRDTSADAAILRAFFEVVAEHGYAGATMDAIAVRAGVAKTTIYRRWPSRDALMIAAHELLTREHAPPDTGALRGDLAAVVQTFSDLLGRPPMSLVAAATIGEMAHNDELARLFRSAVLGRRLASLTAVFERAAARGEIPSRQDWVLLTELLVGPVLFHAVVTGEPVNGFGSDVVDAVLRVAGAES